MIGKRNISTALVALFVLLLLLCSTVATATELNVKAAILQDLQTDTLLYEQDADELIAPASLTKVLTLYLAYQDVESGRVSLDDTVTVSRRAAGTGGSNMNLQPGETLTLGILVKGLAVASGNDAAMAIAEYLGGDVRSFVKRMNKTAKALGMADSRFANPHGLPARGQVTTARDMLRLARAYLKEFPQYYDLHAIQFMKHNNARKKNCNMLLRSCYGVDGLKTGYVAASGFNIVVTAKRGEKRLLAVVLGGKTSTIRTIEATKLIEAGFALCHAEAQHLSSEQVAALFFTPPLMPGLAAASADDAAPGAYVIQESSWKSVDDAQKRVLELKKAGLAARVKTVNLGSKGLWHRVFVGSFPDKTQARRAKQALKEVHGILKAIVLPCNS